MDSSEDEDTGLLDKESIEKRSKLQSWFHFCEEKVNGLEKTWNRKLEHAGQDPVSTNDGGSKKSEIEEDEDHESIIDNMFANFDRNRLVRSNQVSRSSDSSASKGVKK